MTTPTTNPLDASAAAIKEAAAKFADHVRQQTTLKAEFQAAASDAQAAGCQEFADLFGDMAAKLGAGAAGRPSRPTTSRPAPSPAIPA
jgi:hypothetical protein